jgi:hypothetical protein
MGKNLESNSYVECKLCKSYIKKGANKCKECESYQKWYQIIFLGLTRGLALFLALLSILVILGPKIDRLLNSEPETHFSFLYYEYNPFVIKVICSNSGYSNAILKKAEINLGKNTTKELYWEGISPVLQAKGTKLFDFTIKYIVSGKKFDYSFDSFMQDLEDGDDLPNLKITVIHSGKGEEIIHKLNLPRPRPE